MLSIAVPVPGLGLLTYSLPPGTKPPAVGARVLVPLGTRILTGIVVGTANHVGRTFKSAPPTAEIKPVLELLDDQAFVPEPIVELALWVAEYYAAGPGEAIALATPPGTLVSSRKNSGILFSKSRKRIPEPFRAKTVRVAHITPDGLEALEGDSTGPVRLTTYQREALSALRGAPGGIAVVELRRGGVPPPALARLAARGLVRLVRHRVERDPFAAGHAATAAVAPLDRELTPEQQEAIDRLTAGAGRFGVTLLHGVTGSGKTEIYLRVARAVLGAGRRVLMLVPEIALTPAVAAAFRAAFGDRISIQHSGLSDGERYDQWQRIRRGDVDVVVGTRSAVFTPLAGVGLIIVDEEHDTSYKQEESPRYHGRDVAVMRGKRDQALVVLGSATPSLESHQNAVAGRYTRIALARRVLDRPLAHVRIIDMREEYREAGPDVILSAPLCQAIEDRLARREQALVLLNRRGLATSVFCRQCAGTLDCPNCSVTLTIHGGGERLRARCHYCNYAIRVPKACPRCAGPYLERAGFGTERVEAEVAARFPAARVARLDRDTIRRRGAVVSLLERFGAGEIDVLVGTQMIAKGHDFPRVTLVGVISADVGLGLADFRAAERTFQLLTQVAGRAGRGEREGEAIVQTLYPGHYSIRHACQQDYVAFADDEMRYRRAMRYPPVVALVNAVLRAPTPGRAMEDATDLSRAVARAAAEGRFSVLGPAPAPLAKLRGEHRAQFFIKGTRRATMREALRTALDARPDLRRRTTIDVDPISML